MIGAGGTMLALPFLPSLFTEKAYAAVAPPRRFLTLIQDNGRSANQWYPNATESAKLRDVVGVPYMREMMLRDIAGNISQVFGSAFNGAIRDKMMLLRGLDGLWINRGGHQMSSILAALASGQPNSEFTKGPSIDYIIAKNLKSNPQAADPRSYLNLRLDMGWDTSFRYNTATNTTTIADRYNSPAEAFKFIFGSYTQPQPVNDRRKKVVDLVLGDYKALMANTRLARDEKNLVQEHIDVINQLESSIIADTPMTMACTPPTGTTSIGLDWQTITNLVDTDRVIKQQLDLMIAAVKCGIVNVGSIFLSLPTDNMIYNSYNGIALPKKWHDDYTHATMESQEILAITQRHASHFSYMINALNVPEPGTDGTYLDNSIVYWGNAMGNGLTHEYTDMPVVLAGGLGGKLRTGRYINYQKFAYNAYHGRSYNGFLVAIMQAFGLSPADYQQPNVAEGFGDDTFWITGAGDWAVDEAWRKDRKNPTPGVLA